jgi:hypothetical protein
MNEKLEIGLKIKEFAKNKFGSVTALATKIGKKPQYFNTYINGRSYPGGELLAELYELGCDLNWLLKSNNNIAEPAPSYAVNQSIENAGGNLQMDKSQIAHSTINETHNNGVNENLTMELVLSQREQIKYLHDTINALHMGNNRLMEQNSLLNKTVDATLIHLSKLCQDCFSMHKSAHKKVDVIADSISKKKKNGKLIKVE